MFFAQQPKIPSHNRLSDLPIVNGEGPSFVDDNKTGDDAMQQALCYSQFAKTPTIAIRLIRYVVYHPILSIKSN